MSGCFTFDLRDAAVACVLGTELPRRPPACLCRSPLRARTMPAPPASPSSISAPHAQPLRGLRSVYTAQFKAWRFETGQAAASTGNSKATSCGQAAESGRPREHRAAADCDPRASLPRHAPAPPCTPWPGEPRATGWPAGGAHHGRAAARRLHLVQFNPAEGWRSPELPIHLLTTPLPPRPHLAGELLVDAGKGVDLVLGRVAVLGVQEHLKGGR
jgi:hypothetical protein